MLIIPSLMSPFHEQPPPPPPPPPHEYPYEKPFPCFLGSTSSSSPLFPLSPLSLQYHEGLHELLFSPPNTTTTHDLLQLNKEVAINGGVSTKSRSRSFRKDRHSKIFTAQGPRDRRMRLSREVARRFFDLQDMLAFDKPSKTVQWLLNKAKSAIKEVASISKHNCRQFRGDGGRNSLKSTESSASDIEDVSTISEQKAKLITTMSITEEKESRKTGKAKREVVHMMRRRATADPMLVRECRAKARARARERTKEKKMMMRSVSFNGATNEIVGSSCAAIETLDESVSHDLNSSLEFAADVDEPCSHTHSGTERVFGLLTMSNNESSQASDYDINLFQEHWSLHFTGDSDDQFHAKQLIYNDNNSFL